MSQSMTPDQEQALWQFPCRFPVKVMGERREGFQAALVALLDPICGPLSDHDLEQRLSREGRFVSITITFQAQSREQIDTVYRALTAHPWVKLVF